MQTTKISTWLDCDPGLDDAFAILYLGLYPKFNFIGLSSSAGNTSLNNTTTNALNILHSIGRDDVIVVKGSEQLIFGKSQYAQYCHGEGGLGGVQIPESPNKAITQNRFQTIKDIILKNPDKVVWANTGSLTNLCFLLREFPQVLQNIQKIVIMGGAIGEGNSSPAAQFNIFFDPHAFKQVLKLKKNTPLVMIPLQVTHTVRAKQPILNFLKQRNSKPILNAFYTMLLQFKRMYFECCQFQDPPIHDPCAINYIVNPDWFQVKKTYIEVDTGQTSYGRTNCYFITKDNHKKQDFIDLVGIKMKNRKKFWKIFEDIFQKLYTQKVQNGN